MKDRYTTWYNELKEMETNIKQKIIAISIYSSEESCNIFEDRLNGIETITNELILKQLNIKFDYVYGGHCGSPLTAWTCEHVIFPVVYDGLEWLSYVHRNPCNVSTEHIGVSK